MPLVVNLRQMEAHSIHLRGHLPAQELDIDTHDEVIQVTQPLYYDVDVQQVEDGLLVQGHLHLPLDCQCVRCLKSFLYKLELGLWTCHLPLRGEDCATVVNDCVDLTPYVREDILLEFPRHPLCKQECCGLPRTSVGKPKNASGAGKAESGSSPWAELNKLKL
jgi:uncharacterized protein